RWTRSGPATSGACGRSGATRSRTRTPSKRRRSSPTTSSTSRNPRAMPPPWMRARGGRCGPTAARLPPVRASAAVRSTAVWRFWTVPGPGEPGHETWAGESWKTGSATAWVTGSYDPDLDLVYWGTGNPGPDYNGAGREGANLYSESLLALDAATGKLRWHFQ